MRNPFRRQTETPAPSLRERAADLSSRLASAIRKPVATFPAAPASLADACLWAVRHRAWIDGELEASDWSDEKFDDETARTNAIFTRAINEPSTSLAEVRAKAALALEDFERFNIHIGNKLDYGERIVHTVLREIVGVGRKAGSPSLLSPDNDLTTAILDGWREWGSVQDVTDDAVQSEADARRRALIHAAMALPATPENIAPKALACAWMEWVETERPGRPRDAYGPADQLVYDIHATVMGRGIAETPQPKERRPENIDLISPVDLAAADLFELRKIHEAAGTLGDVVSAMTWQGSHRLADGPYGDARYSVSGEWVVKLADALCCVISAAEREARRRTPASTRDQEHRLALLAVSTIENGDGAETAAFARKLLAMVEP